jgi:hypothetical protein
MLCRNKQFGHMLYEHHAVLITHIFRVGVRDVIWGGTKNNFVIDTVLWAATRSWKNWVSNSELLLTLKTSKSKYLKHQIVSLVLYTHEVLAYCIALDGFIQSAINSVYLCFQFPVMCRVRIFCVPYHMSVCIGLLILYTRPTDWLFPLLCIGER